MYHEKVYPEIVMDEFGNPDRDCSAEYGLREKRRFPATGKAQSQRPVAIRAFRLMGSVSIPEIGQRYQWHHERKCY